MPLFHLSISLRVELNTVLLKSIKDNCTWSINMETFSVGQAFNINIFFLLGIWPLVEAEPKVIEEEQQSSLYSFFL